MILADTSAWVEFLRDTGSPACAALTTLLEDELATTEPVRMEVLAGARDATHLRKLRRLLARAETFATLPMDFDEAAALCRRCRRDGGTPRSLIDCLVASVAIRADIEVLHHDRDFSLLARYSPLKETLGESSS